MVPFTVQYDEKSDCIVGCFIGKLDTKTMKKYAEEIANVASKHDCKHVLNDLRKTEIDFSTIELFQIPGILNTSGIDRTWRRAIVVSNDMVLKENNDYHFYETSALNQGYIVKIFNNFDAATTWLKQRS